MQVLFLPITGTVQTLVRRSGFYGFVLSNFRLYFFLMQMYPHYLLLMGKEPTSKQMSEGKFGLTFDVMPFNPKKYGESYRFLAVVKFLFTVNEDYREVSSMNRRSC